MSDPIRIAPTDPASPQVQHCLTEYFAELNRRFPTGFDPSSSPPATTIPSAASPSPSPTVR
jgi:hypothetical protein